MAVLFVSKPSSLTKFGTNELLQIELNLIREVTNVSGALQGKTPSAGTSAARYAQESQNATTSLYTILSDMEIFTEKLAMKKCSIIQQFYEDGRKIFNKDGLSSIRIPAIGSSLMEISATTTTEMCMLFKMERSPSYWLKARIGGWISLHDL